MQVEDTARRRNAAALLPIGRDTTAMELMAMGWFAAGREVLWVPIIEGGPGSDGAARACADAKEIGEPRPLRTLAALASLPLGIKGWLLPVHMEDTCVVVVRDDDAVVFGTLAHPITGQTLTFRTDTESGLLDLRRLDAATATPGQSAV
ncbi:MAG: hypothetical protein IOMNBAOH_01971 [Rhodocyclaceae bacterium]|nr:hypothetical protein [Rhodocyclaceae bacterium]